MLAPLYRTVPAEQNDYMLLSGAGAAVSPDPVETPVQWLEGLGASGSYASLAGSSTPQDCTVGHAGTGMDGTNGRYWAAGTVTNINTATASVTLIFYASATDWTPGAIQDFGGWCATTIGCLIGINTNGTLRLRVDQSDGTGRIIPSSVATGFTDGSAHWVALKLTDTGSAGTVSFFTSENNVLDHPGYDVAAGGDWTALGSTGITVTSWNGTYRSVATGIIGAAITTSNALNGRIYYAAGLIDSTTTPIWEVNYANETDAVTSLTDERGVSWAATGTNISVNRVPGTLTWRVRASLDDTTPAASVALLSHYPGTSNRSWKIMIFTDGGPRFVGSLNGTTDGIIQNSDANLGYAVGQPFWVEVKRTLNGLISYRKSATDTYDHTQVVWSSAGTSDQSTAGPLSRQTGSFEAGSSATGTADLLAGNLYAWVMLDGADNVIAGTSVNLQGEPDGSTSFDGWSAHGAAQVESAFGNLDVRFLGLTDWDAGAAQTMYAHLDVDAGYGFYGPGATPGTMGLTVWVGGVEYAVDSNAHGIAPDRKCHMRAFRSWSTGDVTFYTNLDQTSRPPADVTNWTTVSVETTPAGAIDPVPPTPLSAAPEITMYGNPDDLALLDTTSEITYTPVPTMQFAAGTTAFACATINGLVYVGTLAARGNPLIYSYIDATINIFNPTSNTWTVTEIATDLGATGVLGPSGFTANDILSLVTTDNKAVGISVWDYNGWDIATYGRYQAWIVMNGLTVDAASMTIPELRAAAVDGSGALSFPDQTNSFGQTYAQNRGMTAADVLPNGWVCVVDYFSAPAPSINYSGRLKVFDEDGVEQGFYQWPNMTTEDGVLIQAAPKFISADPSSTDPTDMRMIVNFDLFVRGGSSGLPFVVQEMAFNASTGDITPICAPVAAVTRDETVNFSDYTAAQTGRPVYDLEGTCWVSSSRRGTFTQTAMAAWVKTAGERRWAADNPPSPGWENNIGAARLIPDFEFGAIGGNLQLHSGQYQDPITGGQLVVGFGGTLFPYVPDIPLVSRTQILDNPDFVANVDGWGSYGGSGSVTWDAGSGGRLKFTANGTSSQGVFVTPAAGAKTDIPVASDGQSIWGWMEFEPAATPRTVQTQINFFDADGDQISAVVGPTCIETLGAGVIATCPAEVPVGTVSAQMYGRIIGGGAAAEIHYVNVAYLAIAPATHLDDMNLGLSALPVGLGNLRWPAGSSSAKAVDTDRCAWVPISVFASATQSQPVEMPQYLARVNLGKIFEAYVPQLSRIGYSTLDGDDPMTGRAYAAWLGVT